MVYKTRNARTSYPGEVRLLRFDRILLARQASVVSRKHVT